MTHTTELKPCPFCGGEAERVDLYEGENQGASFICCTQCNASGNLEFGFKENFVSNWNRRAVNSLPALVKALEAAEIVLAAEVEARGDLDATYDTAPAGPALELVRAALASHKTSAGSTGQEAE